MNRRQSFHQTVYLLGTMAVAVAMPLSHFLMGLACFLLFLNWLFEWNWQEKQRLVSQNHEGLWFSLFYLIYAIGLVNVTDWGAAGKEMLSKLSFLLAPFIIISSKPFKSRQLQLIFSTFILATLFGCIWNFIYSKTHALGNFREMSRFIDHIRFSLCVVMSIIFCIHYWVHPNVRFIPYKHIYPIISILLLLYLFYSQTLSGIFILIIITLCYIIYLIVNQNNTKLKWTAGGLVGLFFIVSASYIAYISYDYFHVKEAEPDRTALTASGNPYRFEENPIVENGHYIEYYICDSELKTAWAMRSDSVYDELTSTTLIRYLNSIGLRKDSAAVMQLSDEDIRNIENKTANVYYVRGSIRRALYETFFGISLYKKYGIINESSMLERVELWRASWNIIQDHWFLGVGIGQQRAALDQQLMAQHSPLTAKEKLRTCHNQFLTFWLTAGIIPLLYFCFLLIFPFVSMPKRINFVYFALFLLLFLSMLAEDTLDAQTGRMLYTIFAPLLLFYGDRKAVGY